MTERPAARPGHHLAAALCGLVLFALNVAIYATHPRLIATFRRRAGWYPNVAEPVTINDKITWRKVFDRNPLFPVLQDKLAARDYVAARCPDMAMTEILWKGHDPFAIPFDDIHEPVVIKTNHGCGFNQFIHDPRKVDRLAVSVFFSHALNIKWGADAGEWAYASIKPSVYVERMLSRDDGALEHDCKIDVFAGKAHIFYISEVRSGERSAAFFDAHGHRLEASIGTYTPSGHLEAGPLHQKALAYAEALCPELDAIRVDCYIHDGRVWFGEFTLYSGSGVQVIEPKSFRVDRCRPWNILNSHYFTVPSGFSRFYGLCLETRARQRATADPEIADASAPASTRH